MRKCDNKLCEYNDGRGYCEREYYEEDGELYEFEPIDCEDYEEPAPAHVFDEWDWADIIQEDYR